jgi:hypothetical protein
MIGQADRPPRNGRDCTNKELALAGMHRTGCKSMQRATVDSLGCLIRSDLPVVDGQVVEEGEYLGGAKVKLG